MRIFLAVICLLSTSTVWAIDYCSNNRINLGLDAYYRDYSEELIAPKKSDERGMLWGFMLGYERKAPNIMMLNLELDLAFGKTKYDGSLQNAFGQYVGPWEDTTANGFLTFDTEIGYTFAKNKHLFTPFVGIGASSWVRSLDIDEVYGWSYWSAGLQYDYDASWQYQYGLHVKVMPMLRGVMDIQEPGTTINIYDRMTLGNKTHFEISAPIIYKTKPNNKSFWRFIPYYQYQQFGASNWVPTYIPGVVIHEPASRTHIVGLTVAYSFGF